MSNHTKSRVTISIDLELHSDAVRYAKSVHRTSFSGLVTKLLLADMGGNLPNFTPTNAPPPTASIFRDPRAGLPIRNPEGYSYREIPDQHPAAG